MKKVYIKPQTWIVGKVRTQLLCGSTKGVYLNGSHGVQSVDLTGNYEDNDEIL